jgi:hypothetical protein
VLVGGVRGGFCCLGNVCTQLQQLILTHIPPVGSVIVGTLIGVALPEDIGGGERGRVGRGAGW